MSIEWRNKGREYTADEVEDCRRRQQELSRQMTRLIDVLYALVLAQGAVYYRSLFTLGDEFSDPSRFLPVTLALVLIYFTAIQSFIDYHFASEDQPYQLLDKDRRRKDLVRFYLDVLIVGAYSFLLLKCHVLLADPGADLTPVFLAIVAIFALYIVWGELRKSTAVPAERRYAPGLLGVILLLYLALWVAYSRFPSGNWRVNAAFLFAALLIMLIYRWLNWTQTNYCSATSLAAKPKPCPQVPPASGPQPEST
jgi:hypothetical protein